MVAEQTGLWESVRDVIRERRSNLNVDPERPVPTELVDELIELAVRAPNHYRTNPWRFVVLTGEARARISQIAAEAAEKLPNANPAIVDRQRTQFQRAPIVIAIASAADADPVKQFENRYTASAGVQNILLGATAMGLASAWRSGPAMVDPAVSGPVKDALGLKPDDEIVAFVYLGYPIGPPGAKEIPAPVVARIDR
jgi:nitroreductase